MLLFSVSLTCVFEVRGLDMFSFSLFFFLLLLVFEQAKEAAVLEEKTKARKILTRLLVGNVFEERASVRNHIPLAFSHRAPRRYYHVI